MWDRYNRRLGNFIRSRVADDAEADDLLQEVFIRVHRQLCCRPEAEWHKPDAWIYQIARNLIIDHYRRRRETVAIPESLPGEAEPELPEDDPQAELALSVKDMLAELPQPYREALILTEYDGLNQRELADRLGLSFSGAKSRVQRAREKLRDMLLTCCHFVLDRRGHILEYYERCCCCAPVDDPLS
jgi:RNA polymerase sigma-70 factor (ECF subfamily)